MWHDNKACYEVKVNGQNVNDKNLIVFGNEGDSIEIEVLQDGDALFLSGKPIGEPVETYGPFVMNSQEEIQQAMKDYRLTNFGGWPWPYPDNVHPREKGRFALYPDGKIEEK